MTPMKTGPRRPDTGPHPFHPREQFPVPANRFALIAVTVVMLSLAAPVGAQRADRPGEPVTRSGQAGEAGPIILVAQSVDPMRGRTPVGDESRPPPMHPVENKDQRRERAYSMQPPTIPHKIDGYQVDKRFNRCLDCHAREKAFDSRAVPLSVTHYMDRNGNVLGEVSPRRYFCNQCHVAQVEAKPLVPNDFRDIAEVLGTAAGSAGGTASGAGGATSEVGGARGGTAGNAAKR